MQVMAMGQVDMLKRDGRKLPQDAAVDKHGSPTADPGAVAALKPFGGATSGHKGWVAHV